LNVFQGNVFFLKSLIEAGPNSAPGEGIVAKFYLPRIIFKGVGFISPGVVIFV
jgi:hypothetical protein